MAVFWKAVAVLFWAILAAAANNSVSLSDLLLSDEQPHIHGITPPPPLEVSDDIELANIGVGTDEYARLFVRSSAIRDRWIVVFKPDATPEQIAAHYKWVAKETSRSGYGLRQRVSHKFRRIIKAYSGTFARDLALSIATQPAVHYVESDTVVYISDEQTGAPYNLARLSHREPLTNSTAGVYQFDPNPGLGVTVYVLDTGVYVEHDEFAPGRATFVNMVWRSSNSDRNGHGTHVASTAVGLTAGVAKNATVVGVKVMNDRGMGMMSTIIAGLDYVADRHAETGGPSVINMSLGGARSTALNSAARSAVQQGIHIVAAAGNSGTDACNVSPAGDPSVLAVGATDSRDVAASFSNIGPCVGVFAPGVGIRSAWVSSPSSYRSLSGTSMASPLVAGLTAYLVSKLPGASVAEIQNQIKDLATKNIIANIPTEPEGTPNALAYNGYTVDV